MTDAELIAYEIDRTGETVTVRRSRGTTTAVSVTAVIRDATSEQLGTGDRQVSRSAIVSHARLVAAGFPVPPKQDDWVVAGDGTFAVRSVNGVRLAGAPSHYVLAIVGGA